MAENEGDPSHHLDLEAVFQGATEMEALAVQGLLEDAGIKTVLIGDAVLPNLPFEIRVARDHAEEARELIAQAPQIEPEATIE
jgi:hypothetical protein